MERLLESLLQDPDDKASRYDSVNLCYYYYGMMDTLWTISPELAEALVDFTRTHYVQAGSFVAGTRPIPEDAYHVEAR